MLPAFIRARRQRNLCSITLSPCSLLGTSEDTMPFSQSNKAKGPLGPGTSTRLGCFPQDPLPSHTCLKIKSLLAQNHSIFPEHKLPGKPAKRSALPLSNLIHSSKSMSAQHLQIQSCPRGSPPSQHAEKCQVRPSQLSVQGAKSPLPGVLGDLMTQTCSGLRCPGSPQYK